MRNRDQPDQGRGPHRGGADPRAFRSRPDAGVHPQIFFSKPLQQWVYNGEAEVKRHSRIHRTDAKHCAFYDKQSKWGPQAQTFDQLSFPIRHIALNRYQLCDYCFFGGPTSSALVSDL
jgi:hypothetical protein